jgi:hypothetical protein
VNAAKEVAAARSAAIAAGTLSSSAFKDRELISSSIRLGSIVLRRQTFETRLHCKTVRTASHIRARIWAPRAIFEG